MEDKEFEEITVPANPFLPYESEPEEVLLPSHFSVDGIAVKREHHTEDTAEETLTNASERKETSMQVSNSNKSVENEYVLFGRSVACQLQKLPEYLALQSMEFIQSYLVQRRLSILEEGTFVGNNNYGGRPFSRFAQANSNSH